ncbi:MAG: hypothetical protein KIS63_02545 [Caldilineales bacterium]|nr:hypothetical protein [Caldilineales bacterium]
MLLVIPASSQVYRQALAAGFIDTFIQAGAMIGTPGCGPCMGNHMGIPAPGEATISTGNRNFRGRMGTAESDVYLASPAIVAASAVAGRIAGAAGGRWQVASRRSQVASGRAQVAEPVLSAAKDDRSQAASEDTYAQYAVRSQTGPPISNLHPPPLRPGLEIWRQCQHRCHLPRQVHLHTEDARRMGRKQHALEDLDPGFATHVRPGDIVVGGRNWGCGSSREQAVGCLKAAGVQAIVASSFARIYFRNAVNNGILPVVCPEAAAAIQLGEEIGIDLDNCLVVCAAGAFPFPPLSPSLRAIIAAGGLIPMLKTRQVQQKLSEFFAASPLAGSDLDLTRDKSLPRTDIVL